MFRLQSPMMEGRYAKRKGLPITDNPYAPDTQDHESWDKAWRKS